MKILLVRHGETNYNKNRLIQGHSDIELNETGRNQATSAGEKLSDHNIDYAFSSPLKRAVETARLMLDNSNNSQNVSKEIIKELSDAEKTNNVTSPRKKGVNTIIINACKTATTKLSNQFTFGTNYMIKTIKGAKSDARSICRVILSAKPNPKYNESAFDHNDFEAYFNI